MSSYYQQGPVSMMPRPSKPLAAVLIGLLCLWIIFAVGINWGGASEATFIQLTGDSRAILRGEVWRFLTAPLMHLPTSGQGVQHITFSLLGLYFLGTALEQAWGTPRLLRFLALSATVPYVMQWLMELALPRVLATRMVEPIWYGTTPVLGALAIAFALTLREQKVLLFFVIPVGSKALVFATVGLGLLLVLADAMGPSGHLAPFAGMFLGWFFGGGTPSPARRWWLKFRIGRLDAEVRRQSGRKSGRSASPRFEVISGGRDDSKGRNTAGGNGRGMLH
ncbi:MAG: rhomboid family intramembrane serine protease [Polyangiaceae bacterium]